MGRRRRRRRERRRRRGEGEKERERNNSAIYVARIGQKSPFTPTIRLPAL